MKTNFKLKSLMAILIIIMIVIISTLVNAETEYSVGMALTSDSKLKEGETVTVEVKLSSVNAGNGIDTIAAAIDYDTSVFEEMTSSNFALTNDWTPSYAPTTKMLTLLKNSKVTSAETVLKINLKVKQTISVEKTTITFKEIVASGGRVTDGGTGDITVKDASVTISKEKAQVNTPEENKTPTQNTTQTPAPTQQNTQKNTTTVKDSSVKKTTIPKTGLGEYGFIAIVIVSIVAVFSYVLYKNISKDVK